MNAKRTVIYLKLFWYKVFVQLQVEMARFPIGLSDDMCLSLVEFEYLHFSVYILCEFSWFLSSAQGGSKHCSRTSDCDHLS